MPSFTREAQHFLKSEDPTPNNSASLSHVLEPTRGGGTGEGNQCSVYYVCDCVSLSSNSQSVPLAALGELGHPWRGGKLFAPAHHERHALHHLPLLTSLQHSSNDASIPIPSSFRRIGASNGTTPVPIDSPVYISYCSLVCFRNVPFANTLANNHLAIL